MNNMVRSLEYDQNIILRNILDINNLAAFECDLTYGKGNFYKEIPEPLMKFDIDPQFEDVCDKSSTSTGLPDGIVFSAIFDPPFLTYVKQGRGHQSIMARQFGGYWKYDELEKHYRETILEAHRILKNKGLFVVKCQDIIHNHKMHCTHVNFINWCDGLFRLKDLHILGAKHRMPMPTKEGEKQRTQKHARIHHCYFLVMERLKL